MRMLQGKPRNCSGNLTLPSNKRLPRKANLVSPDDKRMPHNTNWISPEQQVNAAQQNVKSNPAPNARRAATLGWFGQ